MSLDPHRLLVLRAVRRAGGVLAAARLLHLTASGVSQHLAKLEAEAGVALVDRTQRGGGRSLRLTAAGHALADHAERIADALADAERELAARSGRPSGALRVGGFSVALSELVAPIAMQLAVTDPALQAHIYEVTEAEGFAMVAAGDLDLMLAEGPGPNSPPRPPGLTEVDVLRDPFHVVLPLAWAPVTEPAQLLARTWITTSYDSATRRALERLCAEHGIALDSRDIGEGTSRTLLAMVANGLGAAIIPELTLGQNPNPDIRISDGVLDPGARMITVLHRQGDRSPAIPHFLAALRGYANQGQLGVIPDTGRRRQQATSPA